MRSYETKDRATQEYLGNAFKIQYFGCNVKLASRDRLAILPDTHGHMQSFSTTHCLQLEDLLYQKVDTESATSRAKIELALWCTRSTNPRSKIILGTHRAIRS